MFNSDNYHWTQDDYTEKGMEILARYLKEKHGIETKENKCSIHLSQRMGKQKIMFDLSLVLSLGEQHCSVEYSSVSKEEDLEIASPEIKEKFLQGLEHLKQALFSLCTAAPSSQNSTRKAPSGPCTVPETQKKASTEAYRKTFTIKAQREKIREFLLVPQLVATWSRGTVCVQPSPLAYTHRALCLQDIAEATPFSITCKGSFPTDTENSSRKQTESTQKAKDFAFSMRLEESENDTQIVCSSKDLPLNTSEKLSFILASVYFQPIAQALGTSFF
ncbi:hypothetical protein NECID01_0625 [Nematocida sp. AWRm77]|nr:hypothetical protein NECID01_0625 [Nematocida sp. AWRm77]